MNSALWVSASGQTHAEGVWSRDTACCAGGTCKTVRGWKGSEQRDQEFTHPFSFDPGSPAAVA